MKICTFLPGILASVFLLIFSESNSLAQLQGKDIIKENYIIGESSELFTIRTQNDTVEFRIYDADGNINENGIVETERVLIPDNEWQRRPEFSCHP